MGSPKQPGGAQLDRRIQAWADEWRAVAGSTAPAERDRAALAIRSLYAGAGEAHPEIVWVPSPAAGILAYAFASISRRPILSAFARGDTGNGRNREFNALAAPFPLEPAWLQRLAGQVRARVPAPRRRALTSLDPVAGALGVGGLGLLMQVVRGSSAASARSISVPTAGSTCPETDAAAAVLGDAWPRLVGLMGADLARSLFAEGVLRFAARMLTDPNRHRDALQAMQPGQWDAVTPVLAAARDVFGGYLWRPRAGRAEREVLIDARLELARSAGPWWALEGLAIVSERPLVLRRDDRGRPHDADGPALAWADGVEVFAWHGVTVERSMITEPERITVETIDSEANAEVRRVLVERFGEERLIREGKAELAHEDETGRLWRRPMRPTSNWGWRDEPVVMVEVKNATPEPDGSRKTYFLRVPPATRTAREAVAWTFALGAVEYKPAVET